MKELLAIIVFLLAGCGGEREAPSTQVAAADTGVPVIYTVNYPLAWMAQQLAGDDAAVVFPAPAGVDPAFWQPGCGHRVAVPASRPGVIEWRELRQVDCQCQFACQSPG